MNILTITIGKKQQYMHMHQSKKCLRLQGLRISKSGEALRISGVTTRVSETG